MSYEIAIAVSTVLISFILIYISTMLNKKDYPGFQFLFFTMGLLFIIISVSVCAIIAYENANTDLAGLYTATLTGVVALFILVFVFFMFKYWKQLMDTWQGKNADDDDV